MVRCLILSALTAFLLAGPAQAQDTVRDTRLAANAALGQGAFAEAIPHLQQLAAWFADSKTPAVIAELESIYYHLGICHFLTGRFGEARTVFATYLKHYRHGANAARVAVFTADSHRYESNFREALKAYDEALKAYTYDPDGAADIAVSIAKCHLAQEQWAEALPHLNEVYRRAPDAGRRNWAATLIVVSLLRERQLEGIFNVMPALLQPDSFASRSVALNLVALETADELFADERYREALWVYRMVYGRDLVEANAIAYKERLQRRADGLRRQPSRLRTLIRTLESIGEVEQEITALADVAEYDTELYYRMGRSYFETKRFRESRDLFLHLHESGPQDRADEALYLAFTSATQLEPWDQAFEIGADYLEKYETGEYYDTVSLVLGQMRANRKEWPEVIAVLGRALEVRPNHENIVECLFLLGYASFMEEFFADTVRHLRRMNGDYPANDREEDGLYWTGMALLFDKDYAAARIEFERLLDRFPGSNYAEDAAFRAATCDFGLSEFQRARERFGAFVDRYPESKLRGEAHVMLGDCEGHFGALPQAVAHYRAAIVRELNIEQYNYAIFRCAEMLVELKDHEGAIAFLQDYINQNRDGSNIPMALHGIGNAMWAQDRRAETLAFYRDAIKQYGSERENLGVDLIVEEWVGKAQGAGPDLANEHWAALQRLEAEAARASNWVLSLRIRRVLPHSPALDGAGRSRIRTSLLNPNNIPHAGPGLLNYIADESLAMGVTNLALAAAREIIRVFPETDHGLAARMILARTAIARGEADEALQHLDVVAEVYASHLEAGRALLLKAGVLLARKDLEGADALYTTVLSTRAWRSLWPEALFGRGEAARAGRKFLEASVFFERIYVLYSADRAWTARAYLARAESLERVGRTREAAETLQEFIAQGDLRGVPEMDAAQALLRKVTSRP